MVTKLGAGVFMETIHCTLGFSFNRNFSWYCDIHFDVFHLVSKYLIRGKCKNRYYYTLNKTLENAMESWCSHVHRLYLFKFSPYDFRWIQYKKNQKLKGFDRMTSCRTREHFNLSASQRWQTGSLKYTTNFCGDRGNLMYIETILFHTVEPNTNVLFLSWP